MKNLFLLFSHTLTQSQELDATKSMGVKNFMKLPHELQELWSNVPPQLRELEDYLEPLKSYICNESSVGDVVLIQGDFGGCYEMINYVKNLGLIAVHSTTMRDVIEKTVDGKVEKFSRFEHVIFRQY